MPRRLPVLSGRQGFILAIVAAVWLLALFNVSFRLDREIVQEWDESLYAISAWEMVNSGQWVAHTFRGEVDYYNSKPPLNFWLIAAAFKTFGVSLLSLRFASAAAGWLTVGILVWWARRWVDWPAAILAGLALSTMYAFFYVHAIRTANTDAINTLLILLAVVTLWEAREARWRLLWLGPILAAVFLLRGMAIVTPLAIAVVYEAWSRRLRRDRLVPALGALVLCLMPIGLWMVARYRFDQWKFFEHLFWYDFVARTVSNIEDHPGSVLFYVDVLQRYHYDWLLAALASWLLFPVPRERLRAIRAEIRSGSGPLPLLATWAAVTFIIPTVMRTKVSWYLHPFYPVFAVGVGAVLAHALAAARGPSAAAWRRFALAAIVVLAAGVAEGKMVWYSYHHRDLAGSSQGLMLAERDRLEGRQVFSARWDRADIFVVEALVGAKYRLVSGLPDFLDHSQPGDSFLSHQSLSDPAISLLRSSPRTHLYRRDR
jgi:4-amino-4-deoxy-L-arabinose transferase-like glycosyltransferase